MRFLHIPCFIVLIFLYVLGNKSFILAGTIDDLAKKAPRMEEEIKKFENGEYKNARFELSYQTLRDMSYLYNKAVQGIDKLVNTEKQLLINGLQNFLKFIRGLNKKAKSLQPRTELARLFMEFFRKLMHLFERGYSGLLNKAQGEPYKTVEKGEFLMVIAHSWKAIFDCLDKISADQTVYLASLEEARTLSKAFLKHIESLKPFTRSGAPIINIFKGLVRKVIAFQDYSINSESYLWPLKQKVGNMLCYIKTCK